MSENCNQCNKPIYPVQHIITFINISDDEVMSESYVVCNDCYYQAKDKVESNDK